MKRRMGLPAPSRTVRTGCLPALTVLVALLLAACVNDGPPEAALPGTPTPEPTVAPLSKAESRDATRAGTRFLDAFVDGDTESLWAMLGPEAQARWGHEQVFDAFLERKFGTERVIYELGEPRRLAGAGHIAVPVTIEFEESAHRLTGPPLLLVREEESLAVADAGPLGALGPIIGTPAPVRAEIDAPVLIYHHFAPQLPADRKQALDTVTNAAFGDQLSWLAQNGYATIPVSVLFNAFYYDLPLPPRPVVLVFDDGYADVYEHAFPLLKERGFGATVAAISGFMGQTGYLSWEQAEEMAGAGVEFVSHTVSHGSLAAMSRDQIRAELSDSRLALEERLGRPVQFFVYPYGEPFTSGSAEAQQMVLELLRETGYAGALTTSSGPPYVSVQKADAPYQLRRIPVSGGESIERFAGSIDPTPTPSSTSAAR